MVQYWEAVASGTPLPAVSAEEAAAAEAYANAAIAAAEAAMAAAAALAEQQLVEEPAAAPAGELEDAPETVAADEDAEAALEEAAGSGTPAEPAAAAATPIRELPESTPFRFASGLPAGDAATPGAVPAAAATPARCSLTPLNFAVPPPTPADGMDPQQAQQLHQLAVSMAVAAVAGGSGAGSVAGTPASAQRSISRLPATPMATPVGGLGAVAVSPLALSALRARLSGSAGGVQDAVRCRLARLKADLAAAQAKLATVDQVGSGVWWQAGLGCGGKGE